MKDKLAFFLLLRLLEVVKESGANREEALCAVRATEAMLPDLDLPVKPTMTLFRRDPLPGRAESSLPDRKETEK